jgi:hypothetical protein
MADRSTHPIWDPLILASQLHTIAKQSQSLMQLCVPKTSHGDFRVKEQKIISA